MLRAIIIIIPLLFCTTAVQSTPAPPTYGEIVFMGDSITEWWTWGLIFGKPVWDEYYEPLGAVNVGVAGDVTQQTIDRIKDGLIADFPARLLVLMIGTNDLTLNSTEIDIFIRVGEILELTKENLPDSKILLLGIFPRGGAQIHQRVRTTNELLRLYDDGDSIRYLDLEEALSTGLGQVRRELYVLDQLHLNTGGYRVWAQSMANLFDELLYISNSK